MDNNSNLYIVESPTKANMIKNLGFDAISTMGHIGEIDVFSFFKTNQLKIIPKKSNFKYIEDRIKSCKGKVVVSTDPDIEGEVIAFRLFEIAKKHKRKVVRNPLYGMSNRKISDCVYMKNVMELDKNKINAGRSRSVFDAILSKQLSKLLKKEIKSELYIGRVQHSLMLLLKEYKNYMSYSIGFYRLMSLRKIKNYKITPNQNAILKMPEAYNTSSIYMDSINLFKMDLMETSKVLQNLYVKGGITYPRTEGIALEESTYNKLFVKASEMFSLNNKYFLGSYENAISPIGLDKKFMGNEGKVFNLIMRRSIASMINNYISSSLEYKLFFGSDKMKKINLLQDTKNILTKIYTPDYVLNSEEEQKPYYISNGLSEYEVVKLSQIYNIGKPSTLPFLLNLIKDKKYIEKEYDDTLKVTSLGDEIIKLINLKFDFLDIDFYQNINKDFKYIANGMQNWVFPIMKLKNQLKLKNINTDVIDFNDIENLEEIEYKSLWFSEKNLIDETNSSLKLK